MATYMQKARKQQGMVLVEGLIAILIFSLGILALVGLQAVMLKQTTDARYRLDASYAASRLIGEMWAHRQSLDGFKVNEEPEASLPNGKRTVAVEGEQVTITLTWQLPGETKPHSHVVVTRISG
ncbi:type IV pilus modification PilV family protein [Noviherbaspirillum denitrificans]|uniref:Type IV pilus modification protein PilV n=1 Tax=Noviherbaspirillum denitrificans TaxID=1968433 RepID=A0A254TG77_9BURK|nr:hypothetical protein [Noviherbaspirillum denitrificans]OWW18678.1 hypothetical protein AYR66_03635 [Noviherbaspirillum denitrificans]